MGDAALEHGLLRCNLVGVCGVQVTSDASEQIYIGLGDSLGERSLLANKHFIDGHTFSS